MKPPEPRDALAAVRLAIHLGVQEARAFLLDAESRVIARGGADLRYFTPVPRRV